MEQYGYYRCSYDYDNIKKDCRIRSRSQIDENKYPCCYKVFSRTITCKKRCRDHDGLDGYRFDGHRLSEYTPILGNNASTVSSPITHWQHTTTDYYNWPTTEKPTAEGFDHLSIM